MRGTILFKKALLFGFLFLGAFPALEVGEVSLPLQYLTLPFFLGIFLSVIFGRVHIPHIAKSLIFIWVFIIFEVCLSGLFGPMFAFDRFVLPRDMIQYVARFLVFLGFLRIFYVSTIQPETFSKMFLIVLCIGMIVGLLQFIPWSGTQALAAAYTYKESYVNTATQSLLYSKRIPGFAGHPTSNGGIAAFTFIVAMAIWLCCHRLRVFCWLTMSLAFINTIASQARMGYVTIFFALFTFYGIWVFIYRKLFKPTMYLILGISFITIGIVVMYIKGNLFVLQAANRWLTLIEQVDQGGNRIDQISVALGRLEGLYIYTFGMSRAVQQSYGQFFIEVEPVNIFVMYGTVGFFFQYLLVATLLWYFFRHLRYVRQQPALLALVVASFVGLLSYQFFSSAYFFFRETFIGLFPWILMGVTVGSIEKLNKLHLVHLSKA